VPRESRSVLRDLLIHFFILLQMYIILDFWTTVSKMYPVIEKKKPQHPYAVSDHTLNMNQILCAPVFLYDIIIIIIINYLHNVIRASCIILACIN
jgi:hypothetical protein